MSHWEDVSPAALLNDLEVLTLEQTAYVLSLTFRRQGPRQGQPNPALAAALVFAGKLRVVDADQPVGRWTVSRAEVRRYLDGGTVRRDGSVATSSHRRAS